MPNADIDILIVGGAGYIGSHFGLFLKERGVRYATLDNLERGHRHFVDGELIEADLRDISGLRKAFEGRTFSLIFHFAAYAHVGESNVKAVDYFQNNVLGTSNLLEVATTHGLERLVFSSTCATYGNPVQDLIDESHPQQPTNFYGRTKLMVEQLLEAYEKQHGLTYALLRYFNAAGADPQGRIGEVHDPETHLIPNAIKAALGQGELTIFGDDYDTPDGTCVRDYVHILDLADAHWRVAKELESGKRQIFNLGTEQGNSVKEIISAVEQASGRPVPYRIGPRRPGDPPKLVASSKRAREHLKWNPRFGLSEIVDTAYRWHAEHEQKR